MYQSDPFFQKLPPVNLPNPHYWMPPGGPSNDSLRCQWTNAVCTTALVAEVPPGFYGRESTIFFGGDNLRVHPQEGWPDSGNNSSNCIQLSTFEGFLFSKVPPYQHLPDDPEDHHLIIHLTTSSTAETSFDHESLGNQFRTASLPVHNTKKNETSKKQGLGPKIVAQEIFKKIQPTNQPTKICDYQRELPVHDHHFRRLMLPTLK